MKTPTSARPHAFLASLGSLAAGLLMLVTCGTSSAQSLTVLPVNIAIPAGQLSTTLTVINQGDKETSVQIRAMAWKQTNGVDELTATDDLLVSPPITTIAPGAKQVVRLVLRQTPTSQEATYRVLLDQIPPAADPGSVRIALRLSIPVFAVPSERIAANVKYRIESTGGQTSLVASNEGGRHDTIRDIALTTRDGNGLKSTTDASPYILAGATRSWPVTSPAHPLLAGDSVTLAGRTDAGALKVPVVVFAKP